MSRPVHGLFESEIDQITQLLGGRGDHARFLFDDLAAEAGYAARVHGAPFCLSLRAAVIAFLLDFAVSRDAARAHTAAAARIEALAILTGGRR